MEKLTVIIPVYNVQNFLKECLDSLVKQEYPNFEVILVDDGSSDASAVLCDKMAREDSRFIVIHKRNKGQSHARNCGIGICDSDYISFIDSDDALINQPFSVLMKAAAETEADIISESIIVGTELINETCERPLLVKGENEQDFIRHLFLDDITTSASLWNKIYKSTLFDELRFEEGIANEDFLYFFKLVCKRNIRFIATNYVGYFHRRWTGSITGSFGHNMIDAVRNAVYAKANNPLKDCRAAADQYLLTKIFLYLVNMPLSYIRDRNPDYLEVMDELRKMKRCIAQRGLRKRIQMALAFFSVAPIMTKKAFDVYFRAKRHKA